MAEIPAEVSRSDRLWAELAAGASQDPLLGPVLAGGKSVCRLPWGIVSPDYVGEQRDVWAHFDGYGGPPVPVPRLYPGIGKVVFDVDAWNKKMPYDVEPVVAWTIGGVVLANTLPLLPFGEICDQGYYLIRVGAGEVCTAIGGRLTRSNRVRFVPGVVAADGPAQPKRAFAGQTRL